MLLPHLGVQYLTVTELNPLRRDRPAPAAAGREPPRLRDGRGEQQGDAPAGVRGGQARRRDHAHRPARLGQRGRLRKLTLAEITLLGTYTYTYTYTTADLRATVDALHRGVFGDLAWVEERRLDDGPRAFVDLYRGHSASAKIVLRP